MGSDFHAEVLFRGTPEHFAFIEFALAFLIEARTGMLR